MSHACEISQMTKNSTGLSELGMVLRNPTAGVQTRGLKKIGSFMLGEK